MNSQKRLKYRINSSILLFSSNEQRKLQAINEHPSQAHESYYEKIIKNSEVSIEPNS